jgi:hypothetical protein
MAITHSVIRLREKPTDLAMERKALIEPAASHPSPSIILSIVEVGGHKLLSFDPQNPTKIQFLMGSQPCNQE